MEYALVLLDPVVHLALLVMIIHALEAPLALIAIPLLQPAQLDYLATLLVL